MSSGVVPVAAPVRVRDRLAAAHDGPRPVLHASSTAIYVDLDGWCLGLVSASATRVPCALWSRLADLAVLGPPTVRVQDGELHVGHHRASITRLADVSAPTVARPASAALAPVVALVPGTTLPADGRLASAHLDQLLGRGPGLTPLGDDVLAGWFATRMAAGRPDLALAAVLRRRLGVTTLLSATLLDCALRGETLPQLAAWLGDPTPTTTEALLAVGATSGAGLLTGARLALTSLANDRPREGCMKDHVELRSGAYADSVTLLQVSRAVQSAPGVVTAQVAMATGLNLEVLAGMGFDVPDSSPNDMVVALRLDDDADVATALAAVDAALAPTRPTSGASEVAPPRTTGSALRRTGPGSVALVSVPGASATVEAMDALEAGHDVMIFSDNVPVAEEVALKTYAAARGSLVMGPDCGTAVIDGIGLGFANTVRPGRIGIVAASGTGCQQLLALLHHAGATLDGVGVRHALGVGGRDLSAAVGGLATREALRRLDADPDVDLVVVVSKPPAPEVAEALARDAEALDTPVELGLLGRGQRDLTAVAEAVLGRLGHTAPDWPVHGAENSGPATGRLLRGLFVGGTLCDESMLMATAALGPVRSNIPLSGDLALSPDERGDLLVDDHTMIDFGDDALTQGRAHPMIDPTLRNDQLARAAADPATGVILLDLVLGHGAEPDPAALLAPAISAARADRPIPVIVSLVGTDLDPQGLSAQRDALVAAGAEVHLSNAAATRRALDLLSHLEGKAAR